MFVGRRSRRYATTLIAVGLAAAVPASAQAASGPNACANSVTSGKSQISVDTTGTTPASVSPGDTITIDNLSQTADIPGSVFVAGYRTFAYGTGPQTVTAVVFTRIQGTNTTEGVLQSSKETVTISFTITDPTPGSRSNGDESSTPGTFTANYDDLSFTAGASGTAEFSEDSQYPLSPSDDSSTPQDDEVGGLIVRAQVGAIPFTFACSPGTVTPDGGDGTIVPLAEGPVFASTLIEAAPAEDTVSGSGTTGNVKPQAFTIDADQSGGTVTYTGANKTYNGVVSCVNSVGNEAVIVSFDAATNRYNKTQVQDNGATGDKVINTMLNASTATANQIAKFTVCGAPNSAKLDAAPAITAGDVTVTDDGV